jgi:hypothetical protein
MPNGDASTNATLRNSQGRRLRNLLTGEFTSLCSTVMAPSWLGLR